MDPLQAYFQHVLNERQGSWPLFSIVFICVGFLIRCLVMKPAIRRAKEVSRKDYQEVKKQYIRRAAWGWLFFFLSLLLSLKLWETSYNFSTEIPGLFIFLAALVSFFLSLLFHLIALASAAFAALARHNPEL